MIGLTSRIGAIMARRAGSVARVGAASAQHVEPWTAFIDSVDRQRLAARAPEESDVPVNPGGLRAQIAFLRGRTVERLDSERGR